MLDLSSDVLSNVLAQLTRIADALEQQRPPQPSPWQDGVLAWLWRPTLASGASAAALLPVEQPDLIQFADLKNVERQRRLIEQNTRQFVAGKPANNVLLTGSRGTGKSSLVKACLAAFHAQGLRLIEVDKDHLNDLPHIIEHVRHRPERFIVFCDDLSFDEGETSYKGLKSVLDGSIANHARNVLIYATSNRRHLLAERIEDNLNTQRSESGELHPGEALEEKVSLSERFGLWISFYAFSQNEYLAAVEHWLAQYNAPALDDAGRLAAIRWATQRGSRSGRIAHQFARDLAGRLITATE